MFLHLSVILFTGGVGFLIYCSWDSPPGQTPIPPTTTGYSQQVGGTHPTGMHTCYKCNWMVSKILPHQHQDGLHRFFNTIQSAFVNIYICGMATENLSMPSKCRNWYWKWCGFEALPASYSAVISTFKKLFQRTSSGSRGVFTKVW